MIFSVIPLTKAIGTMIEKGSKPTSWICVYKAPNESDANSIHDLLTESGVDALVEDWGNTTPSPLGATTSARAFQVSVSAKDLSAVKQIFRKNNIDGTGVESLSSAGWAKPVVFLVTALLLFGVMVMLPGVGKWLFFMSVPIIVLYTLKHLIANDAKHLKSKS